MVKGLAEQTLAGLGWFEVFQDDRMMSILSGVILMVAIGTVVQHSEQLGSWFEGTPRTPTLVGDEVSVNANDLAMIDVLANDKALGEDAAERLVVTRQPSCGRVFVQNGTVQYLADGNCLGRHIFSYGLKFSDLDAVDVQVRVMPQRAPSFAATTPAPEPAAEVPQATAEAGTNTPGTAAAEPAADSVLAKAAPTPAVEEPDVAVDPARLALARPQTIRQHSGSSGGTGGQSDRPAFGEPQQPASIDDGGVPALAARPEPPAGTAGPASPQAPTAGSAPAGPEAAGDISPDTRRLAEAPNNPEMQRLAGSTGLPSAVAPRTDLADLEAPVAPGLVDEDGTLTFAPLPAARPRGTATALDASAAERASADLTAPDAPRPASGAAPGEPGEPGSDAGGFEIAALDADQGVGTRGSAPAALAGQPATPDGGGLFMPERLDAEPLGNDEPEINFDVSYLSDVVPTDDGYVRVGNGPDAETKSFSEPAHLGAGMRPTMSLARIDIPEASAAPAGTNGLATDLDPGESAFERAEPPEIMDPSDSEIALGAPTDGLGPVLDLGAPLTLAPVDTTEPPLLAEPDSGDAALETAALETGDADQPATEVEPAGEQVAALPSASEACVVPPSLTLDIGRAAITTVQLNSPCHAGGAATIEYSDLSLAIALDDEGKGEIAVPGFEQKSAAALRFADGEVLEFDIPFKQVEKIERVALSWDMPVRMDLHALEFGAAEGSDGHVGPASPRSFSDVRRSGGGFLQSFEPVASMGRHTRIYTYYLRRSGENGIVKMMVDFASRREAEDATCGSGALASPGFTITRSSQGRVERTLRRTLAAMPCEKVPEEEGMIANAVGNLVITY